MVTIFDYGDTTIVVLTSSDGMQVGCGPDLDAAVEMLAPTPFGAQDDHMDGVRYALRDDPAADMSAVDAWDLEFSEFDDVSADTWRWLRLHVTGVTALADFPEGPLEIDESDIVARYGAVDGCADLADALGLASDAHESGAEDALIVALRAAERLERKLGGRHFTAQASACLLTRPLAEV
jgi:hypothetical protein